MASQGHPLSLPERRFKAAMIRSKMIKDDQRWSMIKHLSNLSIAKQANQIIASDQVIESNVQFLSQACIRIGGSATTHELVQKDTSPSNSIYSTSRPQVFWEVRLREARAGKLREEVLERLAVEVLESLEPLEHRNYPFASICIHLPVDCHGTLQYLPYLPVPVAWNVASCGISRRAALSTYAEAVEISKLEFVRTFGIWTSTCWGHELKCRWQNHEEPRPGWQVACLGPFVCRGEYGGRKTSEVYLADATQRLACGICVN